jgi:hypothetical protein
VPIIATSPEPMATAPAPSRGTTITRLWAPHSIDRRFAESYRRRTANPWAPPTRGASVHASSTPTRSGRTLSPSARRRKTAGFPPPRTRSAPPRAVTHLRFMPCNYIDRISSSSLSCSESESLRLPPCRGPAAIMISSSMPATSTFPPTRMSACYFVGRILGCEPHPRMRPGCGPARLGKCSSCDGYQRDYDGLGQYP